MIRAIRLLCEKSVILFLFFGIILFTGVSARQVPVSVAQAVAGNFMQELVAGGDHTGEADITLFSIIHQQGDTLLYVFNVHDQGFIIVAAEDEVYPILGYSSQGAFGLEEMPPALVEWLEAYKKQILYIRTKGLTGDGSIRAVWQHYAAPSDVFTPGLLKSNGVEPLITSHWDQGTYYNTYCPSDAMGPGGRALAGCVAVAMAQVMYYYRYPQTGTGSSSYYHWDYGLLSANYSSTTYRWDEMGNISDPKSHQAIAELLSHVGISVEMNYGPTSSGAYSHTAAQALKNYFGYDPSLTLEYKNSYSENSWTNLLKANLDAGQPMYYNGFGSGGHAFNVDGYQNVNHFHFNWGWGGSYDGYFYLNSLHPGSNDFTSGQGAIVNFKPAMLAYPYYCAGSKMITGVAGTLEDGSGPVEDYQNLTDCSWLIEPNAMIDHIDISFIRFNTQAGSDILYIYDGEDATAPLLASISGDTLFPVVTTTGNKAFLRFVSNGSISQQGWLISYEAFFPVFCTNMQLFADPVGVFDDGSGTNLYNSNTNCKYMIEPPPGNDFITLSFNYFSLEDGKDILRVFDPTTSPSILLGIFTGDAIPPDITASNGQMMLIFISDQVNNDMGWEVSYTSTVGIREAEQTVISLYPNPASDEVIIRYGDDISSLVVSLQDMTGKCVGETVMRQLSEKELRMDLSGISEGIYLLRALDGNQAWQQKIIIKR